jgi:hypothetical protein
VIARYDINAIYVKRNDKLDKALKPQRDWYAISSADTCCRLYVRRTRQDWWL